MKKLFLLSFTLLYYASSAQELKEKYHSISAINDSFNYRLTFINDSTVEINNIPYHIGPRLKQTYSYRINKNKIELFTNKLENSDFPKDISKSDFPMNISKTSYIFKNKIEFSIEDKYLIDDINSMLFIDEKEFKENADITHLIDGKFYKQDVGITDGYGLIRKEPKKNRALNKKMKSVEKQIIGVKIIRGFEAYKEYGEIGIYGIVVIETEKK